MGPSEKIFCRPFDGPQFGLKLRGRPGPPGPLPWVRHCYSRSLYLTLKKLSGRTIMPLPLGLPHPGNCVANMFANPYPIIERVPFKRSLRSNQKQTASSFSFIFFCSKICEGVRYVYASGRRVVRAPVRAAKYSHITFRANERLLAV